MANSPDRKDGRSKRKNAPNHAAIADGGNAPTDTRALLRNWLGAAHHILVHIANTRGDQVAYYHLDPAPWPIDAIEVLVRTATPVVEYLKNRHALDVRVAVERIGNAARVWAEKRDAIVVAAGSGPPTPEVARKLSQFTEADLPERRRLDLDFRIVEGACWLALFPLVSQDEGDTDPFRIRRLIVRWALWVLKAFAKTIRDWPPPGENITPSVPNDRSCGVENPERWELAYVIRPPHIPDTDDTPTKLAIKEARCTEDLVVVLPRIERLEQEVADFVTEALDWPQGNGQPSSTINVADAVNKFEILIDYDDGKPQQQTRLNAETYIVDDDGRGLDKIDPSKPEIPRRAMKAGEQYRQTLDALGVASVSDREAYDQLGAVMERSGESAELPALDTWQRNLREYRRLTGAQKNTPRRGRTQGSGSLVRPDDIEPSQMPTRIRPPDAGG